MKKAIPKMGLLRRTSKTALCLAKASSPMERNQESGRTFSIMAKCNPPAAIKMERLWESGHGSLKTANQEERVASTTTSRNMAYGHDTTPTANFGIKVFLSTARRKAFGRSIMKQASSKRSKLLSSGQAISLTGCRLHLHLNIACV